MMGEYIITFHTHYEALVCMRTLNKTEEVKSGTAKTKLIPVPRALSSSCGTALRLVLSDSKIFDKKILNEAVYDSIFILNQDGNYCKVI